MDFIKSAILGAVLSWVVALVVGSQGSKGGQLAIHLMKAGEIEFYWSWPLFLSATGIAWALFIIQR